MTIERWLKRLKFGSRAWNQWRAEDATPIVLDGAKLDAELFFAGRIKQSLTNWRVGFPVTNIDGHDVNVVQGTGAGGSRIKLYFDKDNGLLLRQVRYTNTIVGVNPTQVDYSDYREVAGVKIPYKWTVTWTDGQSIVEMSEMRANAAVDAAKFVKPPPAVVAPAKTIAR